MKKKILSIILSLAVSLQCLCFNVNAETGTDITNGIRVNYTPKSGHETLRSTEMRTLIL